MTEDKNKKPQSTSTSTAPVLNNACAGSTRSSVVEPGGSAQSGAVPDGISSEVVASEHLAVTKADSPFKKWILSGITLIVSAIITAAMLWQNTINTGAKITLLMDNANGIEEGKTLVKYRSVNVGVVSGISFSDDYNKVRVQITMNPHTDALLTHDTSFYVVRPRVETTRISGLDTLLSGSYIQLYWQGNAAKKAAKEDSAATASSESAVAAASDSVRKTEKYVYSVLDDPPVDGEDNSSKKLTLVSAAPGRHNPVRRLNPGDPVYFRGVKVGSVISSQLDLDFLNVKYRISIFDNYTSLLNTNIQFWVNSGINVSLGPNGFGFKTEALMNLINSGLAFDDFGHPGSPLDDVPQDFIIYSDVTDASMAADTVAENLPRYVVLLPGTLGNIARGAGVFTKGIEIGHVMEAPYWQNASRWDESLDKPLAPLFDESLVPVLLFVKHHDFTDDFIKKIFSNALEKGTLCASLMSSSIIAHNDIINLDFNSSPEKCNATVVPSSQFRGYPVIPMAASTGLMDSAASLMDKANVTMVKIQEIVDKVNRLADTANEITDKANQIKLVGLGDDLRNAAVVVRDAALKVQDFMGNATTLVNTFNDKKISGKIPGVIDQLNNAMKSLTVTIESYNSKSPIYRDIVNAASELSEILKSIKPGMEELGQSPSSVIFGSGETDPVPRGSSRGASR